MVEWSPEQPSPDEPRELDDAVQTVIDELDTEAPGHPLRSDADDLHADPSRLAEEG